MLFELFLATANERLDSKALNELTYRDLLCKIDHFVYSLVCYETDENIIVAILSAAKNNKPLVIRPKYNKDDIAVPLVDYDEFGLMLASSGSTGPRKYIWVSDQMISTNAQVAIKSQNLTIHDNILTVCSLNHTGGINAQTLAGLIVGAHVFVEPFNAFNFFRLIVKHSITVSHLIPTMIDTLVKLNNCCLTPSLRLMVAGSDCIYQRHVKFWLDKGVYFMMNYGLTEAGPLIINHVFTNDVCEIFNIGVPLGTTAWCDTKIVDGELLLRGHNVSSNTEWLHTGDCVYLHDTWFMYRGRKEAGCKILPKQY